MSETRFTPGPWDVEIDADHPEMSIEITKDGALIASVYNADDFPCLDDVDRARVQMECTANAHVMKAAPDLYDALKVVTEMLADQRDYQLGNAYPEEYAAVEQARAALAKATP